MSGRATSAVPSLGRRRWPGQPAEDGTAARAAASAPSPATYNVSAAFAASTASPIRAIHFPRGPRSNLGAVGGGGGGGAGEEDGEFLSLEVRRSSVRARTVTVFLFDRTTSGATAHTVTVSPFDKPTSARCRTVCPRKLALRPSFVPPGEEAIARLLTRDDWGLWSLACPTVGIIAPRFIACSAFRRFVVGGGGQRPLRVGTGPPRCVVSLARSLSLARDAHRSWRWAIERRPGPGAYELPAAVGAQPESVYSTQPSSSFGVR